MRKTEMFLKYALYFVFVYCALFILVDEWKLFENETLPQVSIGFVFFFFLFSLVCRILLPSWDVEKYLDTLSISRISAFKRRYRLYFSILSAGFFGVFLLYNQPYSFLWWTGFVIMFFGFSSALYFSVPKDIGLKKDIKEGVIYEEN